MDTKKLYDEIRKVLTWYKHPDESPLTDDEIMEYMYYLLVDVSKILAYDGDE